MIEVYYAEDDETIGKSVKEYLEQQNCKVIVFDRIVDVKKALIGHLPTIVLLDWNMPDGQEMNCAFGFGKDGKLCLLFI